MITEETHRIKTAIVDSYKEKIGKKIYIDFDDENWHVYKVELYVHDELHQVCATLDYTSISASEYFSWLKAMRERMVHQLANYLYERYHA